jgi:hypothetical protein
VRHSGQRADGTAIRFRRDNPRDAAGDLGPAQRALQRLAEETERAGDDALREWAALALLDAIDLGDQLGWLDLAEAERLRETIRAATEDLDRPLP